MTSILKKLRNNWKKTIFFTIVGYVGTDKVTERLRTQKMMRGLALEAQGYGRKPLPRGARTKHITILVNPAAGNRKGRDKFEEFAAPLIHLSGFLVNIVKTEHVSEARELVELIEKTNMIGVAGGDGTLMEVVTGLLRREDSEEAIRRFPIAVLPVGTHNSFATSSLNYDPQSPKKGIAQGAMNISRHHIQTKDAVKVELIPTPTQSPEMAMEEVRVENGSESRSPSPSEPESSSGPEENGQSDTSPKKPYYCMRGLKMGRFCEAEKREDGMPRFLYGKFRTIWSHYRTPPSKCKVELRYRAYCDGCSKCKSLWVKQEEKRSFVGRIISIFRPSVYAEENPKWKALNPNCGVWDSVCVDASELNILAQGSGKLEIQIGKEFSTSQFLREGYRRRYKGDLTLSRRLPCQEVEIFPIGPIESFSIDNEDFPAKPIRMEVLRNKIQFFVPSPPP